MKKALKSFLMILVVLACTAGLSLAGNGRGGGNGSGGGKGAGDGSGPLHDIYSGVYFEYTGTVNEFFGNGSGFELVLADGTSVLIYGLGPAWYWESFDLARPAEGDQITVAGYLVTYGDEERNIATLVTLCSTDAESESCTEIPLRDDETSRPLWSEAQKRIVNKARTGYWE